MKKKKSIKTNVYLKSCDMFSYCKKKKMHVSYKYGLYYSHTIMVNWIKIKHT